MSLIQWEWEGRAAALHLHSIAHPGSEEVKVTVPCFALGKSSSWMGMQTIAGLDSVQNWKKKKNFGRSLEEFWKFE